MTCKKCEALKACEEAIKALEEVDKAWSEAYKVWNEAEHDKKCRREEHEMHLL